jgi:hypothetical protein
MNFYTSADVWLNKNDAPNTSKGAKPSSLTAVKNARVIVVKEAQFRRATIGGTFLLGDKNKTPLARKGKILVEVYCCWFGLRLKTRGLHFKVNMSTAEIIENYSGNVVSDLNV